VKRKPPIEAGYFYNQGVCVMKLAMRVQAVSKKVTLITAAFVLAVSTLTAAVPFVLSQNAAALGPDTAVVYNQAEFAAAANDTAIKTISVKASFTTTDKVVLSGRNVYIDGNGNTITFSGDADGWQGNYVLQAYKINLGIKNLGLTGGDAAIYANGSRVNLEGTVKVSGNSFGGIEVSQGSGVSTPASLNVGAATLVNTTEATATPTAWIDHASVAAATVNGPFTVTTHIGTDQKQYYLSAALTGTVATNTSNGTTYGTLQDAFDAATAGNTIVLNKNVVIANGGVAAHIDKALTFDGNGLSITTTGPRGSAGDQKNAALIVGSTASNVTVKNLTVEGTATTNAANSSHGIIVHAGENVLLKDIVAKNNAGGVMINSAKVTIDTIATSGNAWYGVNVDKAGAVLTIKGVNTHTEAAALFVDNRAVGQVVDVDNRYDIIAQGASDVYILDKVGPTISWQLQPAPVVKDTFHVRPITDEEGTTKSVYIDVVDPAHLCWTLTSSHMNFDTTNNSCAALSASLTDGTHKFIAVFSDAAGNSTTSESNSFVVDRTGPTITAQASSIGSFGRYSKIGYNFFDANKVDYITINGVVKDLSNSNYSNVDNIGSPYWYGATEGTNTLVAYDVLGNNTTISFVIDRTAPTATFAYSNNNGNAVTNQDVTVTLTTSEEIQTPAGWTRVDATHYTKVYSANAKDSVTVTDLAGNSVVKNYEVKRIDKSAPVVSGVANGTTYRGNVSFNVNDQNFDKLYINNVQVTTGHPGGWDYVPATALSGNGTYEIKATDKGGNVTLLTVTINNNIQTTFNAVDDETDTPVISGRATYAADGAPLVYVDLQVIVDGTDQYTVTTDEDGNWETSILVGNGSHEVTVQQSNSDAEPTVLGAVSFTTAIPVTETPTTPVVTPPVTPPADPQVGDGTPDQGAAAPAATTPTITGFAGILGANAVTDGTDDAAANGTPEVEGTSTKNNVAQAVDTDSSDGTVFGLAWYWWLLIIAAIAAILWWIIAAIRNRQSEA